MRLTTLGEAWRRAGGDVVFSGTVTIEFVRDRLRAAGIPLGPPWPLAGDVLVVDTYDPAERARGGGAADFRTRVLVDDVGERPPAGFSVVWNPNPFSHPGLYAGFAGRCLTGIDHVPVRPGLPPWAAGPDEPTVVSLGGGRPPRAVVAAMEQLSTLLSGKTFAAAGDWAPASWRRFAPADLWPEASRAARVVTAAGTTMWEAAAVGVPVVLLQLASNQRLAYRWARKRGVPGVDAAMADPALLAHQLQALLPNARPLPAIQDGAPRVAAELSRLLAGPAAARLRLRPATADDASALWHWANDPVTRAASGNRAPLAWEAHLAWLNDRLASPRAIVLIAELDEGRPVGTIRFETADGWSRARLSYGLAPASRGQGLGRRLLEQGIAEFRRSHPAAVIEAEVWPDNARSLHLFSSLGWSSRTTRRGTRIFDGLPEGASCRP
jgi:RimJ/RimL family protein N-acetyltransferase